MESSKLDQRSSAGWIPAELANVLRSENSNILKKHFIFEIDTQKEWRKKSVDEKGERRDKKPF